MGADDTKEVLDPRSHFEILSKKKPKGARAGLLKI
jgi:hypothetical protein